MKFPMRFAFTIAISGLLILESGCNEPFSPKGSFEQKLVTYSVLNCQTNTQFVRLYLNYNPPGFDPYGVTPTYDTSASVIISSPTQNFSFSDTLLESNLHVFVNQSFRPTPGTGYTLTVVSSRYGSVSASTQIPGQGVLSIANEAALLGPYGFKDKDLEIDCFLAPETQGFLVRFLVDFSLPGDSSFQGEVEVPMAYGQDSVPVYPVLTRALVPQPVVYYPVANYIQVFYELSLLYPSGIVLKWAKFYLIQVDKSLYDYYKIANGFQDPYSIRTDKPDYTNIQNGLGVFGSFNIDSTIVRF